MKRFDHLKASCRRVLGAAGITGAALAAGTWKTTMAGAALAPTRALAAGKLALRLEGSTDLLHSVAGGAVSGDVVLEPPAQDYYQHKHIGGIDYEQFSVELGLGMSKAVYLWIASMLEGSPSRKSGEVVAAEFDNDLRSAQEFRNALISEVGFPALDASSKEPAYLTLTFAPEVTERKPASGKLKVGAAKQKQWLPSNFRFELKGLPTSRINRIEALTIKQTSVSGEIGEERDYEKEPGLLEYPNLVFTLAEVDAEPWYDWFEDFVIDGNNGQDKEKNGSLVYLSPNLQDELGRLEFFNLGIFKIGEAQGESSSGQIRRIEVGLYCERIEFKLPGRSRGG